MSPDLFGKTVTIKVQFDVSPVEITNQPVEYGIFSPDKQQIAALTFEGTGINTHPAIAIFPSQGGMPVKTFAVQRTMSGFMEYSPDGKALFYPVTERGVANLVMQPVGLTNVIQQTHFDKYGIYGYDYDWKNKRLAVSRGRNNNDVVLLTQSQGQ